MPDAFQVMRTLTCLVARGRTALCLTLVLGASTARAQDVVAGSFDELRLAARLGDTMTVTEASGATVTGKLAALSPSALTLLVRGSRRDLAEGDIQIIARHGHGDLARGARLGFAIGAGFGLVTSLYWSAECARCGSLIPAFTLTYASLGAGLGVGFAAITPTRPVIYSSSGVVRRRVAVSPMAAPGRLGAALSVAF